MRPFKQRIKRQAFFPFSKFSFSKNVLYSFFHSKVQSPNDKCNKTFCVLNLLNHLFCQYIYSKMMFLGLNQVYYWGYKCNTHINYDYIIKAKWNYKWKLFATERRSTKQRRLGFVINCLNWKRSINAFILTSDIVSK